MPNPADQTGENQPANSAASERQSANWDIKNAPRNYFSLVLAQGGSAFFAFASIWLITKTLGAQGLGGIVAIIAASQVAQILVNWTSVAVIRFGVDEFIETGKIARAFWLRLFILIPNLLLVLMSANLWFPPLADWLKLSDQTFGLVFLHFATAAFWVHAQYGLQAVKMPRVQGALVTVERVLIFSGLLVLFAADRLNPTAALLCYAVAPLLVTFVGIFYLRNYIFSRFAPDKAFIKKLLAYSLPLMPFGLVGYFSGSYVDAVFISKFLSTRDLGIYSIATQVSGIALQFPTLANSLLTPFFITLVKEKRTRKLDDYFKNTVPVLVLGWGLCCVFLAFAAYFLIPPVFGGEFTDSVAPLWILLAASVFSLPILIGYSALSNSVSATYISMFAAIFSAVTNIAFNFWLIPEYGATGCAWATVITYFVSLLVFYGLLRRKIRIPLSWTWTAMLPILSSAAAFSLTRNPFVSLLICVGISVLMIFLYKNSLLKTFDFLKNYRKT